MTKKRPKPRNKKRAEPKKSKRTNQTSEDTHASEARAERTLKMMIERHESQLRSQPNSFVRALIDEQEGQLKAMRGVIQQLTAIVVALMIPEANFKSNTEGTELRIPSLRMAQITRGTGIETKIDYTDGAIVVKVIPAIPPPMIWREWKAADGTPLAHAEGGADFALAE